MSGYKVIPAKQQKGGALLGGFWVVMQAWPIANLWTVALLGPEGAKMTDGFGSWEVAPVPRDVGITEWTGRKNYTMDVDLLYDGFSTHPLRPSMPASFIGAPRLPTGIRFGDYRVPVEGMVQSLEKLALRLPGEDAPHSVRVFGAVPHPEVRWVIQGLDFGDAIRDKVSGRRLRQQVTVHLLEYNQPGDLKKLPRSKYADVQKAARRARAAQQALADAKKRAAAAKKRRSKK